MGEDNLNPYDFDTRMREKLLRMQIEYGKNGDFDDCNVDDFDLRYKRKEDEMNYKLRNAAIILDETITTIGCAFGEGGQVYTFLCPKPLASQLEMGQRVLGQKSDNTIVCLYVHHVDDESEVQLEDTLKYGFVFQAADHSYLKALNDKLEADEKALKDQQRARLREEVKNQLILEHKGNVNVV